MEEVVKLLAPINTTELETHGEGTDISPWMQAGVPGQLNFFFICLLLAANVHDWVIEHSENSYYNNLRKYAKPGFYVSVMNTET